MKLTRALAWAAATDEGNRHMHRQNRKAWSEDDYNAAVDEFYRLWPDSTKLATFTSTEQDEQGAIDQRLYEMDVVTR